MEFTTVKRINPSTKEELFYPFPAFGRQWDIHAMCKEISYASSVNASDVRAIIGSLMELLPAHLMMGDTVKLNDFGIFRLFLDGTGKEKAEDISASDIKSVHLRFLPDPIIKRALKSTEFVKI